MYEAFSAHASCVLVRQVRVCFVRTLTTPALMKTFIEDESASHTMQTNPDYSLGPFKQ